MPNTRRFSLKPVEGLNVGDIYNNGSEDKEVIKKEGYDYVFEKGYKIDYITRSLRTGKEEIRAGESISVLDPEG